MISTTSIALQTPEILEAILLQLPPRDLLVTAQRINHEWKLLISTSPALQEALFLQNRARNTTTQPVFNPLLKASFAPWFEQSSEDTPISWPSGIDFHTLDWTANDSKANAHLRAEASWRRMLPVQPAVKRLVVELTYESMGGVRERTGFVDFDGGVRMGTLYDMVQEEIETPHTTIGVKWEGLADEYFDHRVVVTMNHVVQCTRAGRRNSLGPDFRSAGHQEVVIKWGEWKYTEY